MALPETELYSNVLREQPTSAVGRCTCLRVVYCSCEICASNKIMSYLGYFKSTCVGIQSQPA